MNDIPDIRPLPVPRPPTPVSPAAPRATSASPPACGRASAATGICWRASFNSKEETVGVALLISACVSCRKVFGYHPHKVPSITIQGKREPICRACVLNANPQRRELGLPEIEILPGAYDGCPESEL